MTLKSDPDLTCVPYRRKGLYFALTIPLIAIMLAVFIYLWRFGFLIAAGYLALYLITCAFQAYCCAYQECPYIGGFCPAIAAIMPASPLAKLLYSGKRTDSKRKFEIYATIAGVAALGLIGYPLYWLAKAGVWLAVAYGLYAVLYLLVFTFTICPVCATRRTCPAGQVHQLLRKAPE